MKNIKRILAVIAIIILVGLYVSTLVCALLNTDGAASLFKASIYSTIVLPALIWIYTMVYKWIKKKDDDDNADS